MKTIFLPWIEKQKEKIHYHELLFCIIVENILIIQDNVDLVIQSLHNVLEIGQKDNCRLTDVTAIFWSVLSRGVYDMLFLEDNLNNIDWISLSSNKIVFIVI